MFDAEECRKYLFYVRYVRSSNWKEGTSLAEVLGKWNSHLEQADVLGDFLRRYLSLYEFRGTIEINSELYTMFGDLDLKTCV